MKLLVIPVFSLLFLTCSSTSRDPVPVDLGFKEYWFQGKAEITSYKLEQARYGEIRKGEAVLVFVTEGFSKSKQVKLDDPYKNKADAIDVLKLNLTKKFNTGIYPYSLMTSVFTPVDQENYPRSLKATATAQEWCGHTFTQLNLKGDNYNGRLYSYFETEADHDIKIPSVLLEDEIWTKIRINPSSLPTGEITVVPGLLSQRLRHTKLKSEKAKASVHLDSLTNTMTYHVDYTSDDDRELRITFNKDFPYKILSWEETYMDGFGENRQIFTTRAVKHKSIFVDYWNKNKNKDSILRDSLGLSP